MNDYRKRCAKCKKYKKTGGGHQKVRPGNGMYFVCADCYRARPRK